MFFSLFSVSFLRERRKKKNALCVCVCCSVNNFLRPTIVTLYLPPFPSSLFKPRHFKKYSSSFFYFAHFHVGNRNTKSSFLLASCQVNNSAPPTPVFPSYIFAWRRKKYENNNSNDFSLYFSASVYGNQTHLAPIQKLEPGWVYCIAESDYVSKYCSNLGGIQG